MERMQASKPYPQDMKPTILPDDPSLFPPTEFAPANFSPAIISQFSSFNPPTDTPKDSLPFDDDPWAS